MKKYFAYGSNMSIGRLRSRVPSAERKGCYFLTGHKLAFHKKSIDGSGKCDAHKTDNCDDRVYGALFEIEEKQEKELDLAEGFNKGYNKKTVQVENENGDIEEAMTYYATEIAENLNVYTWYLNHVVIGAGETGVPEDYLDPISKIECIEDTNAERAKKEFSFYKKDADSA